MGEDMPKVLLELVGEDDSVTIGAFVDEGAAI